MGFEIRGRPLLHTYSDAFEERDRLTYAVTLAVLSRTLSCSVSHTISGHRGGLVRIIDTREAFYRSRTRLLVQSFGVSCFANAQRSANEDLDQIPDGVTSFIARLAIGGNRRHQHGRAVACQQVRHECDAAYVLISVLATETEIFAEMFADEISIDDFNPRASNSV